MRRYKRLVKRVLMMMSNLMPFNRLRRLAGNPLIIINYHSLQGLDPDPVIYKNTYRTEQQLEKDLLFFKKSFNLIDIMDLIHQKELPENALLITIDDGLKVVFDHMFPLFKKLDMNAILFVNPDFIDNNNIHYLRKRNLILKYLESDTSVFKDDFSAWLNEHELSKTKLIGLLKKQTYKQQQILNEISHLIGLDYQQYLQQHPVYLSSEELEEMIDYGFKLGGHSMDHPLFKELTMDEQLNQVIESVDWVVNKFGLTYKLFAFPSNEAKITKTLFHLVHDKIDASFGVQGLIRDEISTHYHRIEVESTGLPAEQVLKYEYMKHILRQATGKSVFKRNQL